MDTMFLINVHSSTCCLVVPQKTDEKISGNEFQTLCGSWFIVGISCVSSTNSKMAMSDFQSILSAMFSTALACIHPTLKVTPPDHWLRIRRCWVGIWWMSSRRIVSFHPRPQTAAQTSLSYAPVLQLFALGLDLS